MDRRTVQAWEAAHRQHLASLRERAGGKRINVIEASIGVPRPSPVMVWTPEQTARFFERATRHRLYALYRLIALRGLHRGEACGIRKPDVDPKKGTIAISWQITVLLHRRDRPLHPAYVTDQFQWLAYEAGLPPIRLHDLRHGAASLMLAADVDIKIVQHPVGLESSIQPVTWSYVACWYSLIRPVTACFRRTDDRSVTVAAGWVGWASMSGGRCWRDRGGIFPRQAQNEGLDRVAGRWPAGPFTTENRSVAANEVAVPAQDGVRRDDQL